jgi:hypothetical protein
MGWVPWFCRENPLLDLWQVPHSVEAWGPKSQIWLYKIPMSSFGMVPCFNGFVWRRVFHVLVVLWFSDGFPMIFRWFSVGKPMVSRLFPYDFLWFSNGFPMDVSGYWIRCQATIFPDLPRVHGQVVERSSARRRKSLDFLYGTWPKFAVHKIYKVYIFIVFIYMNMSTSR